MRKYLHIDLRDQSVREEEFSGEQVARAGRYFIAKSLVEMDIGPVDPLGPENPLIFSAGPFAGSSWSNANRTSVGCKSPLTGGIKESNGGGSFGLAMGQLHIAGFTLYDAAAEWVVIHLRKDGSFSFDTAAPYMGKGNFECVDKVEQRFATRKKRGSNYAALLVEPGMQGPAGMIAQPKGWLGRVAQIAQGHGTQLIADEVMTGFGRTGTMFASNQLKEQPDIMAMSKGLTGGTLPLSITSCSAKIFDAFWSDDKMKALFHGHSYTANPVGCAAALASLDLMEQEESKANIRRINEQHASFRERLKGHPALQRVQQTGTILALEFTTPDDTSYFNDLRDKLYYFFLDRKILLRPLGNVIYILPPYCITNEQLASVYSAIEESLTLVSTEEVSK